MTINIKQILLINALIANIFAQDEAQIDQYISQQKQQLTNMYLLAKSQINIEILSLDQNGARCRGSTFGNYDFYESKEEESRCVDEIVKLERDLSKIRVLKLKSDQLDQAYQYDLNRLEQIGILMKNQK